MAAARHRRASRGAFSSKCSLHTSVYEAHRMVMGSLVRFFSISDVVMLLALGSVVVDEIESEIVRSWPRPFGEEIMCTLYCVSVWAQGRGWAGTRSGVSLHMGSICMFSGALCAGCSRYCNNGQRRLNQAPRGDER